MVTPSACAFVQALGFAVFNADSAVGLLLTTISEGPQA